ncbi:MAG: hypothetical protein IKB36_02690 [Clostridia bacterium]|nr:hypothetical protein [Clostridia bacterium]
MRSEKYKKLVDTLVFTMLGVIMLLSKLLMEALPNFHLLGTLITAYTIVYRKDALKPIYIFVLLSGIIYGFGTWWFAYLYIWAILWGMVMLLPKNMQPKVAVPVYMIVSGLHGLLYGTLFAPAQAIIFGYDFKTMIAWIIAGFSFDIMHCVGNVVLGILILPITTALKKFHKY